jgi:FdhD protein
MDKPIITTDPAFEVNYQVYDHLGRTGPGHTQLALEAPLELSVNDIPHSILMRTPGADLELVTGYLFTEGLIQSTTDIGDLEFVADQENLGLGGVRAKATLPSLDTSAGLPERPVMALSSCGLCGKESLGRLKRGLNRIRSKQQFPWKVLATLVQDLRRHQPLYDLTRGVHAVAMYQAQGEFLECYEDVGRHNALDKVIGRCLGQGCNFQDKMVVLSGRASLEIIIKVARAGLPLLLCFSSPTVLAVESAKSLNLTLVARQKDLTLAAFTHQRRLTE